MRSRHVRECEIVYPIISKYKTRQRPAQKSNKADSYKNTEKEKLDADN